MNESLLESISLIEESVLDAEMDTLMAMANEYSKIVLLTEYADEEVLNEYEIVQEAFIMEAKKDKEPKQKDDKPKEGIIAKLKHAWGVIMGLLSKVGEWFAKKVSKVREKFSKNKGTTANPEAQQVVQSCKEDISDIFFTEEDFKEMDDPGVELTDEDVQSIMNNFKANPGKLRKLKGDLNKLKVMHNKGFIDAARKGNLKKDGTNENIIDKVDESVNNVINGNASKQEIVELFEWVKDLSKILGMYHEKMMSPEKAAQMPDVENNPKWVKYIKKLWTESPGAATLNAWFIRMNKMYPGFKTDYSHFTGYTVKFKGDVAELDDLLENGTKDQIMSLIHKLMDPVYPFYADNKETLRIRHVIMDRSNRFVHDDEDIKDFGRNEWNNPNLNETDMVEIKSELEKFIDVLAHVVGELRGYNSFLLYVYDHFTDSFLEEESEQGGEQ